MTRSHRIDALATDASAMAAAGLARRLALAAEYLNKGRPVLAHAMLDGVSAEVKALAFPELAPMEAM